MDRHVGDRRVIGTAYGAGALAFLVLLLAAWQFWQLEISLTRQIALTTAAYAQEQQLLDSVPASARVPEFVARRRRADVAIALARTQRHRTLLLIRVGFASSCVLLVSIFVWIAAFGWSMRRARVHRDAALHDGLTGLGNRAGALHVLQRLTERNDGSFGVVFLDLDGFKKINDLHGHACGDELLQGVAQRLKSEMRSADYAARLGGDEFVCIIAPPTNARSLQTIAERLQHAVSRPYIVGSEGFVIGCSAGFSMYPEDGLTAQLLLERADRAMYGAKSAGGGVRGTAPAAALLR